LLFTWLFFICLLQPGPGLASDEEATPASPLVVEPASIKVARFDRDAVARVMVVTRAAEAAGVPGNPKLAFITSPGLEVTLGDRAGDVGEYAWQVSVRAAAGAPDDGVVDFRLVPETPSTGLKRPSEPTHHPWRAQLKVKVAPDLAASPIDDADISIRTESANVSDHAPGRALLLVGNKSSYPFTVDKIEIESPEFLTVAPKSRNLSVGAHETLGVPLEIKIPEQKAAPIGEIPFFVSVTVRRGENDGEHKNAATVGTAVVEQKVTVGVPGVSDALTAIGLPSLLLVPGALVLATWSLLLGTEEAAKFKWLDWKSSSFWVVSITISIIVFGIIYYMWSANLLIAYNVKDVAWLWIGSVSLSAVTFGLNRALKELLACYTEPRPKDEPIDIMKKLQRANLPFYLQSYVRTSNNNQKQTIFRLTFSAPNGKVWVIPLMLLAQLAHNKDADALMLQIDDKNRQADDKGRDALVENLKKGLGENWISFKWQGGEVGRPSLLSVDHLGEAVTSISPIR
jgi:hypothetical protein